MSPAGLATEVAKRALEGGLSEAAAAQVMKPYAQVLGGITQVGGAYLKGELGARITSNLSAFAEAGFQKETGWVAGLGARWEF